MKTSLTNLTKPCTHNSRLYPSLFNSRFWVLTSLRKNLESIAAAYLVGNPDAIVVDYGCGTSPYQELLAPYLGKYVRVDITINANTDYYIFPDGTSPLPNDCADVVLSTQVLEHVGDPAQYLDECYRTLKPGGYLVLSTHGYWQYHPDPDDLWRWTGSGLRKLIETSHFAVDEIRGVLGLAPTGLQLLQDSIMPKMPRSFQPVLAAVFQAFIRLLDSLYSSSSRSQDACLFIAVASKPRS